MHKPRPLSLPHTTPSFVAVSAGRFSPQFHTSFVSFSPRRTHALTLPHSAKPARLVRTPRATAQSSAPRREYFATCAQGLGPYLASELRSPHVNATVTATASSGVHFVSHEDSHATAYAACLWLRTATRVLYKLAAVDLFAEAITPAFPGGPSDAVYHAARDAVHWPRLLDGGRLTFSVQARVSAAAAARRQRQKDSTRDFPRRQHDHDESRHPRNRPRYRDRGRGHGRDWHDEEDDGMQYVNEQVVQTRVKDAVCDALRDAGFPKPDRPYNYASADAPVFVTVHEGVLTVYLDMGGGSLHKRGYRSQRAVHRAQLNEAVAAGMLYAAGFDALGRWRRGGDIGDADADQDAEPNDRKMEGAELDDIVAVDPMCGSGTLLTELCLLRLQAAVGLFRRDGFAFERWGDFDARQFDATYTAAQQAQRSDEAARVHLLGSDADERALRLAASDVRTLGLEHLVSLQRCTVRDARVRGEVDIVLSNPPWGRRLEYNGRVDKYEDEYGVGGVEDAWTDLGQFFREQTPGATAVVISGDATATRGLRMKARRKVPVRIGNVDTRVLVYDVLPAKKISLQNNFEHME